MQEPSDKRPSADEILIPKLLENSNLALVCCCDEWRGWVGSKSPNSESCTATSPYHSFQLTGNFLVTVVVMVKSTVEISQNFVPFSEYMNSQNDYEL